MKKLAKRIKDFLEKYAHKPAHLEGEYTGPDPLMLEMAAEDLDKGLLLKHYPWSEWGSGCYKPYSSKEGRLEHDAILEECKKFIKK